MISEATASAFKDQFIALFGRKVPGVHVVPRIVRVPVYSHQWLKLVNYYSAVFKKIVSFVFYNLYSDNNTASGQRRTPSSQYLCTIGTRKEGDTSVRFSQGSTLSGTGARDVRIGSAEDDSDDDWFVCGTGAKDARVKLEKNKDGQEVLTIRFVGWGYALPGGYWMDVAVHTMFTTDQIVISEGKYNDALLKTVEQDYDADKVAQGRAVKEQVIDEEGCRITDGKRFRIYVGTCQPDPRSTELTGKRPMEMDVEVVLE